MKGKILGYSVFKSKKGAELINFTVVDDSVVNGSGTCCTNVLGYQNDFPNAASMLNKVFFIDTNNGFASGSFIEVK